MLDREHLILAKQVGVKKVIVFVNKADIVDDEMLELVEMEVQELLAHYGFDANATPIIRGSAKLALNGIINQTIHVPFLSCPDVSGDTKSPFGVASIEKLVATMDEHFEVPERDTKAPFVMPIDRSVVAPGRGSIVVGMNSHAFHFHSVIVALFQEPSKEEW